MGSLRKEKKSEGWEGLECVEKEIELPQARNVEKKKKLCGGQDVMNCV